MFLMTDLAAFKDPGEVIEKDPAKWREIVEGAQPVIDWYLRLAFGKQPLTNGSIEELTSQQKKEIAQEILPVI